MTDDDMDFGTPNYDKKSGGGGYKQFKLKQADDGGSTTARYRILPPIHDQAATGKWALYGAEHWGYKARLRDDPSKTVGRAFNCVFKDNYKTKAVIQDCEECTLIAETKKELEEMRASLDAEGKSKQEIKDITQDMEMFLREHNLDRKWRMWAINEEGELGRLSITGRCKKVLDEVIKKHMIKNADPLSVTAGAWFEFTRTGRNRDVQDTVTIATETKTIGGQEVEVKRVGPIDPAIVKTIKARLPDLSKTCFTITPEQVKQLVSSDGDLSVADKIFAQTAQTEERGEPVRTETTGVKPVVKAAPKEEPAQEAKVDGPAFEADAPAAEEDEDAKMEREMAEMAAKLAAKKAAKAEKKPKADVAALMGASDEAFIALMGGKK